MEEEIMSKIIKIEVDDRNGLTCIHYEDGYRHYYEDIRIGLSWPVKNIPGYYCIFGQVNYANEFGKKPVRYFTEKDSKDIISLFNHMSDYASLLKAKRIYTDLGGEFEEYREIISEYCSENDLHGLHLKQAPWANNFHYSVRALIQEYRDTKAMEYPENTTLGEQVNSITEDDHDPERFDKFYAVKALKYVLASFRRYPPTGGMTSHDADRMQQLYGPPGIRAGNGPLNM